MTGQAHAAVIYNPIKVDLDSLKAEVGARDTANGWGETLWFSTSETDAGQDATRSALKAGATMVIAAGGDGTVRAVAEAVYESDAVLALLPSGTGNLLARNLNLTLDDMGHSLDVAFSGTDRSIDLGLIEITDENREVTQHAYVVMAGLGLDAKMLANTDDELKKRVGWLAYVRAMADALRDKNELTFRYRLDGDRTRSMRAHTLIVGNCGALPGNIVLLPDAAIDDGEFDILLLRPESVLGWLQIFAKVLWENGIVRRTVAGRRLPVSEVHAIRYARGRTLDVQLMSPQPIELDGDEFGMALALSTSVKPGGLRVRVPSADMAKPSLLPAVLKGDIRWAATLGRVGIIAAILGAGAALVLRSRRHRCK
ncbi:MAG: diacylglycerol kinase family protein [Pseudolysinimonas sp.]